MADIEKVIKGLECCLRESEHIDDNPCKDCPYNDVDSGIGGRCMEEKDKDALELLKVSVSQNVADQFRWERDTAIQQLSEIGKGLGEKMDDIEKIVRCKDCKHGTTCFGHFISCEIFEVARKPDFYCADVEKRSD